jgi:membrane protease YdiL (CAAX protease family)
MIQRLSPRAEFWFVVVLAYALPTLSSIMQWTGAGGRGAVWFSDRALWSIVIYELVVASLILGVRRWAGTTWRDMLPSWPHKLDGLHAIGLYVGSIAAMWLVYGVFAGLSRTPVPTASTGMGSDAGIAAILAVSVVNPVFEEWLHLGFVQARMRAHGAATAVGAGLLLRLMLHIYQGPAAVVGVLPIGLVFGIYAWKTQRLWPVILVHAAMDFFGLMTLSVR